MAIGASRVAPEPSGLASLVKIALALWLVVVFVLGARGTFVSPPGTPPLPILLGAIVPLVVFLAAWFGSVAFRAFVMGSDLRLGTAMQAWRAGGFAFIALYAHGVLPGLFAWPAGLGDMAIGATAPWVMLALARRPAFAASRTFVIWNLLGILDLVVAIGTGALSSGLFPGTITTTAMARLPLVLIPAYLVPLFVMLHLTALFQARRVAAVRQDASGRPAAEAA